MSASAHADDHSHHRFQAHHFETGEQQFQAGKLGMWLFLSTEVLFFSGMFCAYAAYRAAHPQIFEDAAKFLKPELGAANTIVLLLSSLTVAWSVRCVQLNDKKGLLANLIITLACAGIFMGVKTVEYSIKFTEGLFWRGGYTYVEGSHPDLGPTHERLMYTGLVMLGIGVLLGVIGIVLGANSVGRRWAFYALAATVIGAGVGCLAGNAYTQHAEGDEHHAEAAAHADHEHEHGEEATHGEEEAEGEGNVAVEDQEAVEELEGTDRVDGLEHPETAEQAIEQVQSPGEIQAEEASADVVLTKEKLVYASEGPKFPGVFFSIYYAMTGVHAIHILAGIGVFVWIVSRAARDHFEPHYYGPVEYTGLYWHLVDLIWIFLFPLLYLIQ